MRAWPAFLTSCCFLIYINGVSADVELDSIAPRLAVADPAKGEKIFLQCRACHVAKQGAKHTVGPNLWNLVGRLVASEPHYSYSQSIKQIGGHWDYEKLSRYLFDPMTLAPGTRMVFPGIKRAEERANLIAYLRTLSNKPLAMPSQPPADIHAPTYGGLPDGDGREAVYFTCRACHSLNQFTQERMSREQWSELLVTMVQENGMETPENWARQLMLDYLDKHFGKPREEERLGLPPGPGREEVFYTCKACHSLKLVQQQGLSRKDWDETLDWMVEEQGMDEIENEATRDLILDYLSTHYGRD